MHARVVFKLCVRDAAFLNVRNLPLLLVRLEAAFAQFLGAFWLPRERRKGRGKGPYPASGFGRVETSRAQRTRKMGECIRERLRARNSGASMHAKGSGTFAGELVKKKNRKNDH